MGHQTCIFNLIISPYQVTEIPTKSTLDVTTTVSNVKNLSTSSYQPSNKSSVLEDLLFDNTIASTTMQKNANNELELEYSEKNTKVSNDTIKCTEKKCYGKHGVKNVKYNTTEADSSLSDEVVIALQEKTGWVCNGTVCTDLGPIYERKNSTNGNKRITLFIYPINCDYIHLILHIQPLGFVLIISRLSR